jgi:geranylgeranyl diphosphate synthase, type II
MVPERPDPSEDWGRLLSDGSLTKYLNDCRQPVLDEIRRIMPKDRRHTAGLYEIMLDYPLRYGKMLRPALTIAACRAFGGSLAAALPTAAVLELYHNAFLIHDDVEDLSYLRRSEATLNRLHGAPTAINVGDAMLALTMQPLLDNMPLIGLGKTLKILRLVARMARETAEGQMIELRWISGGTWTQDDRDYTRLVHKKTSWYTFIAPVLAGALIAGLEDGATERLGRAVVPLGVAFQIQDDLLNLVAEPDGYGKDLWCDLWEGKHTLILIHALQQAPSEERDKAIAILSKPPPTIPPFAHTHAEGGAGLRLHPPTFGFGAADGAEPRNAEDVAYLRNFALRHGGVAHARATAARYARHFQRAIGAILDKTPPSPHRQFFVDLADFTTHRKL